MKILVADDDAMFLKVMEEILTDAGYDVILAANGLETVEKAVTKSPDLIVLDIILPGLLGTEVCEKLRKSGRTASIPILLVTSGVAEIEAGSDFIEQFKADGFLRKPFEAVDFLAEVKRLAGSTSRFAGQ